MSPHILIHLREYLQEVSVCLKLQPQATTDYSFSTQHAITQATSIPGDATVVVTAAQDGATTQTYTVSL